MKLVFITDCLTLTSGGVRFLINVFKKLSDQHYYEVYVITGVVYDDIKGSDLENKLYIINLNVYKPKVLPVNQFPRVLKFLSRALDNIRNLVRYNKEIIIHLNNHFPNLLAYFRKTYNVPIVCSIHHLEETKQFDNYFIRLGKLVVQDVLEVNAPCSIIHVPSRYTRDKVVQLRILKDNIVVIPPGIEVSKYTSLPRKPESIFLMIGRLESRKHYDHAIMAFKIVTRYRSDLKLVIIGDGPLMPMLSQMIKRYSLENNIVLLGNVSEQTKLKLLSRAKALIHLGYPEGFGITLIEALAVGVPVIVYDVPPLNELIKDKVHGLLVRKDDIIQLARTILSIDQHKFDERLLRLKAMMYDINIIANHFHRLYKQLSTRPTSIRG